MTYTGLDSTDFGMINVMPKIRVPNHHHHHHNHYYYYHHHHHHHLIISDFEVIFIAVYLC